LDHRAADLAYGLQELNVNNGFLQQAESSVRTDIDRRQLIITAAGAAAATFSGATWLQTDSARADDVILRVTHFGGPYQVLSDVIAAPFQQATKTKVEYDVETASVAVAKIQSQKLDPPFDIIMVARFWALRAYHAGLLARLDAAEIAEAPHLMPQILPAAGWGASAMLDSMDLMVDTKQVTKPVTSWLDLWRDDLKGKIMLPSAANGPSTSGFLACLVRAIGGDMKSDAAVDEAFTRLKALKPAVRSFYADGSQPNILIERGDIGVAPQFAIRIANTSRQNPHIVKASPKEGMLVVPYDLCIAVNSTKIAAAKAYINFALTKPVQEAIASNLLATPVRDDVTIPSNISSLVNTDANRLWFQDEEYAAAKQREWLDRYTREVQS
jgi:putative spermidine/putrescine transport system substrate-binding protein